MVDSLVAQWGPTLLEALGAERRGERQVHHGHGAAAELPVKPVPVTQGVDQRHNAVGRMVGWGFTQCGVGGMLAPEAGTRLFPSYHVNVTQKVGLASKE
jgi:hypothetical protein